MTLSEARQLALKAHALTEEGLRLDREQESRLQPVGTSSQLPALRKFTKVKVKNKPPPRITMDNKGDKFDPRNPIIIRRTP